MIGRYIISDTGVKITYFTGPKNATYTVSQKKQENYFCYNYVKLPPIEQNTK